MGIDQISESVRPIPRFRLYSVSLCVAVSPEDPPRRSSQTGLALSSRICHGSRHVQCGAAERAARVRLNRDSGNREVALMRWGLVPFWAKDAKIAYTTINARAEEAAAKPAYREA